MKLWKLLQEKRRGIGKSSNSSSISRRRSSSNGSRLRDRLISLKFLPPLLTRHRHEISRQQLNLFGACSWSLTIKELNVYIYTASVDSAGIFGIRFGIHGKCPFSVENLSRIFRKSANQLWQLFELIAKPSSNELISLLDLDLQIQFKTLTLQN